MADGQELLEALMQGDKSLKVADLRQLWDTREGQHWSEQPELYRKLAERTIRAAEPFWTHDICREGLQCSSANHLRLTQLQAMALAQCGSPLAARKLLLELKEAGHEDVETLGLLGRTCKDLSQRETESECAEQWLMEAYQHYYRAFKLTDDYYPGINAATLAVLLNERERAAELAVQVQALCRRELEQEHGYWVEATLAEAALILDDEAAAVDYYRQACALAGGDYASIASMRRQALLLQQHRRGDATELDACFRIGKVIAFTGHRLDESGRSTPRFPVAQEEAVKEALRKQLEALDARIGYASGANGGDILFLEAMLERGGDIHIVLPVSIESFREVSVEHRDDANWSRRFEALLADAASVTILSNQPYADNPAVFTHANEVLTGLARLKAQVLDTEVATLALWDREGAQGQGGTADAIATWRKATLPIHVIDPLEARLCDPSEIPAALTSQSGHTQVKAILFTDVVGFSKLREDDVPVYLEHFLGGAAQLLEQCDAQPIIRNTWGDALFLVFDEIADAGHFALALRDLVDSTDWQKHGLSRNLRVRIGLHAGPVWLGEDPVTRKPTCIGSHVNQAARIEPITEEGQIYASEAFAALAAIDPNARFACDYLGQKPLPKQFGTVRLYLLRPRK